MHRPRLATTPEQATTASPVAMGFLTDATLCIGCKACEVACKQWNRLPAEPTSALTGFSYDNTVDLGATTWRHVAFVELTGEAAVAATGSATAPVAWLMLSDVCKHCVHAGCLEACPTGAIVRTEFGTVVIQQDVCNGCGYCVPACPFGVPQLGPGGTSAKCTLCYDRLQTGQEPACAQACPTDSIRFGAVADMRELAAERVATLKDQGIAGARLYGDETLGGTNGIGGLNALFVLTAPPETYNLPAAPELPQRKVLPAFAALAAAALGFGLTAASALRERR
jgi:formate dehydrogenase iron-sulfur subunit